MSAVERHKALYIFHPDFSETPSRMAGTGLRFPVPLFVFSSVSSAVVRPGHTGDTACLTTCSGTNCVLKTMSGMWYIHYSHSLIHPRSIPGIYLPLGVSC